MSYRELNSLKDIEIHKDPLTLIFSRKKGFLVMGICDRGCGFNEVHNIIISSFKENKKDESKIRENIDGLIKENNLQGDFSLINHSFNDDLFLVSKGPVTTISFSAPEAEIKRFSKDLHMLCLNQDNFPHPPWSLSNLIFIQEHLDPETLLKCFKACLQSKERILENRGVPLSLRKSISDESSILVACLLESPGDDFLDKETDFKSKLEDPIYHCLRESCNKALDRANFTLGILDYIYQSGIILDDLVEAGLELTVGVEVTPSLKERLLEQILKSLSDINVITLILAGLRLEDDITYKRLREVILDDDPAYFYSDEILGLAIANQIAGTKAIFNFKRYDELKPGIISNLGPVLDDIFAGLLAGCMSKVFES